ncbi:MAG: lipid II:glycine glycyltransferase FemX [Bacilli bacterium]
MKIIELTETQFKNYSKLHSSRNYFQTAEFSHIKKNYNPYFLGFINENNNTLMGATLILEKKLGKLKIGYVPGGFLVDYDNDNLFRDFINTLKTYLKDKKYVYLNVENRTTYKMFDKNKEMLYYDTNIIKELDKLSFVKNDKKIKQEVILETEKTPNETYKMFNSNTKRNINLALQRAITIYKDENNNIDTLLNLTKSSNSNYIRDIINNFNTSNVTAEIYFAKINPEQYINNYRFLLKEEEERNDKLNDLMQNINIKKTNALINKKMTSDRLITKYNNEIIKATNIYTKYPKGAVIGAILIVKNNREIYFLDEGYNKDLEKFYSSHLIKWEIIKKYLNLGYKIFNFGQITNMDKNNGNYTFKMGFGGKVYEYIGNYDLIINKWLYGIVKLIYKLKK